MRRLGVTIALVVAVSLWATPAGAQQQKFVMGYGAGT